MAPSLVWNGEVQRSRFSHSRAGQCSAIMRKHHMNTMLLTVQPQRAIDYFSCIKLWTQLPIPERVDIRGSPQKPDSFQTAAIHSKRSNQQRLLESGEMQAATSHSHPAYDRMSHLPALLLLLFSLNFLHYCLSSCVQAHFIQFFKHVRNSVFKTLQFAPGFKHIVAFFPSVIASILFKKLYLCIA